MNVYEINFENDGILRFSLVETLPPDRIQFVVLANMSQSLEDPVIRRRKERQVICQIRSEDGQFWTDTIAIQLSRKMPFLKQILWSLWDIYANIKITWL